MKILVLVAVIIAYVEAQNVPTFSLPSGVELILGGYNAGFSCEGRIYGYYADQSNDCRVFHVCVPILDPEGHSYTLHYPFACGNQSAFNQEFLICDYRENVDCARAQDFYAKNEDFGKIPPQTV